MSETEVARLVSHFDRWQGLRWIPFAIGAASVAIALTTLGTGAFIGILAVGVAAMGAAERWIDTYYGENFGRVRDLRTTRIRNTVLRYGAILPAAAAGLADVRLHLPVLITGLVAALYFLVFWAISGRRRLHWPIASAVMILAAVGPLAKLVPTGASGLTVVLLIAAVAEAVGGLLDHRMFVTRVRKARHEALV